VSFLLLVLGFGFGLLLLDGLLLLGWPLLG